MNNSEILNYSNKLKQKGFLLCLLLFTVVLLMFAAEEYFLSRNRNIDSLINISGTQRMLSQKLAFEKSNNHVTTNDSLDLFIKYHKYLKSHSSPSIKDFYINEVDSIFNEYIEVISNENVLDKSSLVEYSEFILIKLDDVVKLFEKESNHNQHMIYTINISFLIVIGLTLLFIYLVVLSKERGKIIKLLKNQVSEKNKALEDSRAKSKFLANMSYELRTPLSGILGLTNSLRSATVDKTQMKYLNAIRQAAKLLRRTINEIIDFSNLETTQDSFKKNKFSLEALVLEVESLLLPAALQKGLYLKIEKDASTPSLVKSDPMRIKQFLMHLVSNAIKFTEEGGVTVKIYLKNKKVVFEIIDTGVGISKKNLKSIFNDSSKGEDSYTKTKKGSGLGLAIIKKVIDGFGGKLDITSTLGSGSCFKVTLELEILKDDKKSQTTIEEESRFTGKMGTVLVVEDNKVNQVVIRDLLKSQGIKIEVTDNGQDAIKLISHGEYDLILMDISMPVMNGFDATKEIRKFNAKVPIFCISANAFEDDKRKALESGMNEFLQKPLRKHELIKVLNKYFSS